MKKFPLIAFVALALTACEAQAPAPLPTDDPVVVIVDDECPRADGEPCK